MARAVAMQGKTLMAQFRRDHPLEDPRQALRSVAAAWQKHPSNPKNAPDNASPTQVNEEPDRQSESSGSEDDDDDGAGDVQDTGGKERVQEKGSSDSLSDSESETL